MRSHLETAARQGSLAALAELEGSAELPDCAAHVWQWFNELHAARGSNGYGPDPLRYADIDAWLRITGAPARAYEIAWLLELDRTFLRSSAEAARSKGAA